MFLDVFSQIFAPDMLLLVIGGVLILAAVLFSDIKVPTRRREGPPNS
jgi:hypothetical protein